MTREDRDMLIRLEADFRATVKSQEAQLEELKALRKDLTELRNNFSGQRAFAAGVIGTVSIVSGMIGATIATFKGYLFPG